MKKKIVIISILALIKLTIQLIGNRNYGFHRDELLHLSASEHLEWGFMEFPPFIGFIGRLSDWLFGYSLMGTRMFPTLAGVAILVLTCLVAKELKGNKYAVLLAGICVLSFLPFYRNHTLFQPVAFDQLFWTLGFYYLIRFLNTENHEYLILTGLILGIGLMNKYTILIWAFGVFIGMIFYYKGRIFKNKWWYISGLLSVLIILPNIIWQFQNNLPLLRHLQELSESQLSELHPLEFGIAQLNYPFTFFVSIVGVVYLIGDKRFRSIGIASIIIFFTMWFLHAKAYYVFALYPVLFGAGSVKVSSWLEDKNSVLRYAIAAVILLPSLPYIPHLTPVLSIQKYVAYSDLEEDNGRIILEGDYADMFGWEEQVRIVDSLYRSLTPEEKNTCVIWAENYGEAGALKIIGNKYGLPDPISRHGSFWKWGYGNENATVWISIGNETPSVEYIFEQTELVSMIYHKYAIGEENGIPLYICRKPKLKIKQWWADYEPYIFN